MTAAAWYKFDNKTSIKAKCTTDAAANLLIAAGLTKKIGLKPLSSLEKRDVSIEVTAEADARTRASRLGVHAILVA